MLPNQLPLLLGSRRSFLKGAVGAGLAVPALEHLARAPGSEKLSILILGGTAFLGPQIVEAAVAHGHQLTLFNRGKTNPHLFPDLEKLHGDRNVDADLAVLDGRKWDAVIDTSAYFPKQVDAVMARLGDRVGHCVFVSTVSVYSGDSGVLDEDSPVGTLSDEEVAKVAGMRDVTNERYGPLKALCEQAAEKAMPGKVANVRPGLIVGPGDTSDRFAYWPARVARGGEVLAPGDPGAGVQFIDVRDLGEWIVALCEARSHGVMNAVGFPGPVTLQEVLHGCKMVSGADCTFTWADADFLREQGVRPWAGSDSLPMWIPGRDASFANRRATDAGLRFRPIADTIRDTLAWHRKERDAAYRWRAGVSVEKEAAVLAAWRARASK